jgi:TolB protein
VSFEWSPDGTRVAYADDDLGTLYIVDARSGDAVATVSDNVVGFFWSPDSTQIAYVTITREDNNTAAKTSAQQQSAPVIRWNVYNVTAETTTRLEAFLPSRDMIYYLQFYDQFARSHRLWSPDSRYFVYGEITRYGQTIVSLQDTRVPGAAPQTIMEGGFGVFSW